MQKKIRVLAFVLAGGEGKRLAPLTQHVAKPAVPFHTDHRLVDFALSNLLNSGITAAHVLLQYRPQSVLAHLAQDWQNWPAGPDAFLNPIVGGKNGVPCYCGTADAVYCNRNRIDDFRADLVAVFGADHVYRMDVRQMIEFHLASAADVTIAALPVPVAEASGFGVMATAADGRIRGFAEKPSSPVPMPGHPGIALASMGNYVFSAGVLRAALEAMQATGGTDFGRDLLPSLLTSHRLMAYDFTKNDAGSVRPGCAPHYWRDVGTIDAYFAAHMDTLGPTPRFQLSDPQWPIGGGAGQFGATRQDQAMESLQSLEVKIPPYHVDRTILRHDVHIGERAQLSRCIVGERVRIGAHCRLLNTIVEPDNQLPDGFEAGFNPEIDRKRWPVSAAGIVVVPRGSFPMTAQRPARCKINRPIHQLGSTVRPESDRAGRIECQLHTSQVA